VQVVQVWRGKGILFETVSERNVGTALSTYVLEACRLDFTIQINPFEHLSPGHTCENGCEYSHRPPHRMIDIPLYSIGLSVKPPNVTILIWCRSNIRVAKWEQVDAQFPLPTGKKSSMDVTKTGKEDPTNDYVAGTLVLG
jgi:hypothetical protein